MQAALEALPQPGPDNVSVAGAAGGPYTLTFVGSLADTEVPQYVADSSSLEGPGAAARFVVTNPGSSGEGNVVLLATNIGGAVTGPEPVTVTDDLPPAIAPQPGGLPSDCTAAAQTITCSLGAQSLAPVGRGSLQVRLRVRSQPGVQEDLALENSAEISGGARAATASDPIVVSDQEAGFGLAWFGFAPTDAEGGPEHRAAAHPNLLTTGFDLNGKRDYTASQLPRDVVVELPLGLYGNPTVAEACPQDFVVRLFAACPLASQIGVPTISGAGFPEYESSLSGGAGISPLFNIVPDHGYPAEFALDKLDVPGGIYSQLVHTPAGYVLRTTVSDLPRVAQFRSVILAFFGDPDAVNGVGTPRSFFTTPSDCSAAGLHATIHVDSWADPAPIPLNADGSTDFEAADFSDPQWASQEVAFPTPTGCDELHFEPTLEARPTTQAAESPSGLNIDLKVPQNEEAEGRATPPLKDATVTLPAGIAVNPSSADGLGTCSESQIDVESTRPGNCPDASKLGEASLKTPLLANELPGAVYLGTPACAPCTNADAADGELVKLYIEYDDPLTGVVLKLPGSATTDTATGQLKATFADNPQLPFSELKLKFKEGDRAPLTTPATCGPYETTSSLTPWSAPQSGPPATPSDHYAISSGANGGACAGAESQLPHDLSFSAGTQSTQAGAYSPFVLNLSRPDGSQRLKALNVTLPPGLTGKLAGVAECSDASIAAAEGSSGAQQKASPSCPASSELGSVDVAAGSGPPFHVSGHAYLAGPYKGAPLSMAIVTPAVAGPFDLGTVVVRAALDVDPFTTQITVKSDPIPQILAGIPLDIRSISVNVSRNQFTLNPTSCEKMSLVGTAFAASSEAGLSNPFQVGGCSSLGFKPKLQVSLKGGTRRSQHPALKAILTYPSQGAYANIARAQVSLPHSEFLDQGNLNKVCTQGELNTQTCPARSVYGHARAWSPLLDKPLEGPVYLGVGFGYKLPALVAELNGQIRVLLKGKVDTDSRQGIRNTFEAVPDAPVSRFVLEMKGGAKYGLLENSEDICAKAQKAEVSFGAQNGKVDSYGVKIANSCGKAKGKSKSAGLHKHNHARGH